MRVIFLPPQSASQPAPPGGSLFAIDSNASHDRRQALPGESSATAVRGERRDMPKADVSLGTRNFHAGYFPPPSDAYGASSPKGEPFRYRLKSQPCPASGSPWGELREAVRGELREFAEG